jgi:hypothetical protein
MHSQSPILLAIIFQYVNIRSISKQPLLGVRRKLMNQIRTYEAEVQPKKSPALGLKVQALNIKEAKELAIKTVKSWGWNVPLKLTNIWEVSHEPK